MGLVSTKPSLQSRPVWGQVLLLEAFLKAKENIYLRFSPQRGHQWNWAHRSLLLVLNKRSLLQEQIPLFIHIYRFLLMDTWINL